MTFKDVRRSRMPGLLFLLFAMVVLSLAGPASGATRVDLGQPSTPCFIHLKVGSFDPLQALPGLPARHFYTQEEAVAAGVYLVQFTGAVMPEWKQAVVDAGGQLGGYVPDNAFLVHLDAAAGERVRALGFVRWVGPFHPAYRLAPDVDYDDARSYRVRLASWADPAAAQGALLGLGIESRGNGQSLVAVLDGVQLDQVARLADVVWIEPMVLFRAFNDVGGGDIMGGATVWANGYTADDVTVAIADTGLDTGNAGTIHQDFSGRVAQISSWPVVYVDYGGGCEITNADSDDGPADVATGHGTHVAGSVAGDGARSGGQVKGLGYEATVTFQAIEQYTTWADPNPSRCPDGYALTGIPEDMRSLLTEAYNWGARVHNDSWGGGQVGVYDEVSSQFDDFVYRNPDMTIVVAAGNDGEDADADGYVDELSISSPATAKNVISVGASDNERASGGYNPGGPCWTWFNCWGYPANPTRDDRISDDREELAAFSSRGPMLDGRIKPDVVAPGTNILSARSSMASGIGWGLYDDYYLYMGGTSMASPLTAGAAALVREYYIMGERHDDPSAALIKATLINSAVDITGYGNSNEEAGLPIPNNHEGWGRVDVAAATTLGLRRFEDNTLGVGAGLTETYAYGIGAERTFKVTLAWSDASALPAASPALVNDLDLRLTAPNGATYWGNNFAGGWSLPDGGPDTVNNVENVYIQSPVGGTWTVEVIGRNVPQGFWQPFALVVSQEQLSVTGIQPSSAPNNALLADVVINGTGFMDASQVFLARAAGGMTGTASYEVITGTVSARDAEADTLTVDFALDGATPGWWDVWVKNSSVETVTLESAFFVMDSTLPDLRVSKTASESEVDPASWLTYTIIISNAGYVPASGIVFTDILPLGATFERLTPSCGGGTAAFGTVALPGGFICQAHVGSLLVDGEIEYTLVVSVTADARGMLINQVAVGSAEPDAIPDDNGDQASVRVRSHGFVYMPLVLKVWPPLPGKPDLLSIDNVDQDGNYTLSWAAAATGPETTAYDLQENGEIIAADYAFTSYDIVDRGPGTYSYRVRGKNSYGFGRWSDSRSVVVISSVFEASADAYVLQGRANTNLGAVTSMWVGYDDSLDPDGKIARSFVQFDLSGIAAGTAISEAILYLRLYNVYDFEGQSRLIAVYRTDSPWSELGVTWNSRPSFGEAIDAFSVEYEGVDQWYAVNVTGLVRGWINGRWPNYGLAILGPEHSGTDSSWRSFYTRETSSDPYLYITFSTGSVD